MTQKSNKQALADKANKASRLDQLTKSPGWKDFEEIILNTYNSAMNDLLEKENPEARGACNAITEIMNSLSSDIDFGERAREQFKKKFLHNQMDNGQ